jgi:glycosyltransferase involved in cell wall biosynthesis
MSVNILLATYNSAQYLKAQLDSLFAQSYQNFIIYVHDDGSIDETLSIINEYAGKYVGKIILLADKNTGKGACISFMWLLENTSNSYYMFCDHDDVWLPNKIEKTLEVMVATETLMPGEPVLVYTDLKVVDVYLSEIYNSFWKYSRLKQKYLSQFKYLGICNGVTGCTMMINNNAKKIVLPIHPNAPMHDHWIALNIAKKGKIVYLNEATILYRQHSANEIGAQLVGVNYYFKKIQQWKKTFVQQKKTYSFIKTIGYGSVAKYYWYKMLYFFIRNV